MKYVYQLPTDVQNAIMEALVCAGIEGDDLERAMSSKVIDLEDTIDISMYV